MALYTINLISHHGTVRDADELDCDTDEEAVAFAEDLNVPASGNGYDVWQEERLVRRHREREGRAWSYAADVVLNRTVIPTSP